jgi:predicted ATPase
MPERQQTLRATVDWSVGLLGDAERSLNRSGVSGDSIS